MRQYLASAPNGSFSNMVGRCEYCLVSGDGAEGEETSQGKPSWGLQPHLAHIHLQYLLPPLTVLPGASCWRFLRLASLYLLLLPLVQLLSRPGMPCPDPCTHTPPRHGSSVCSTVGLPGFKSHFPADHSCI